MAPVHRSLSFSKMVLLTVASLVVLVLRVSAQPVNFSIVYPDGPAPPISTKQSLHQELSSWEPLLVFTTLLNAHSYLLSGDDLMVLAPTNAAFLNLLARLAPQTANPLSAAASITQTLDKLINSPNLTRILAYHVVQKSALETELGTSRLTASGGVLGFTNFPFIEDADPVSSPRRTYRQIQALGGSMMIVSDVLLPVPLESMLPNASNMGNPGGVPNGVNSTPGNGSFPGVNQRQANPVEPNQTLPGDPGKGGMDDSPAVGSGGADIFSVILNSLMQPVVSDPFISNAHLMSMRTDMQIMGALVTLIPDLGKAAMSSPLHILAPTDTAFIKLFGVLGQKVELPQISLSNVTDSGFFGNLTKILQLTSAASEMWGSVNGVPGLGEILQYHLIPQAVDYDTLMEQSRSAAVGTVLQNHSLVFQPDRVIDGDPSRGDAMRKGTYPTLTGYVTVLDNVVMPFDSRLVGGLLNGAMGSPSASPRAATLPQSEEAACFPADAMVGTKYGARRMGDILAGDEIQVDEQGTHSAVFLFTHKLVSGSHTFIRLHTACGFNVTLTAGHYVSTRGGLLAAGRVRVGDVLRTVGGASAVIAVGRVRAEGLVAPHTVHGGLMVDGVRVSGYSTAVHPWLAHALLAPVRWYVKVGGAVEPLGGWLYRGGGGLERFVVRGGDEYLW